MSGIYIHIPFCKQACSYCDFYFVTQTSRSDAYVQRLLREIGSYRETLYSEETVETIYFGGGTPSLLSLTQVEQILKKIEATFHLDPKEITFELNPDDVTAEFLQGLKAMGVNRASMGVQSFQPDLLTFMNRAHSRKEALKCLELLSESAFQSFTVDLIYGNPGQTLSQLEEDLDLLLQFDPPHISAYSLTIEPATKLGKQVELGRILPPEDDKVADHFEVINKRLQRNGIERYEVSNYSKPDKEALHNSNYWQHKNYLGFGPGAHSFWWGKEARRWQNESDLRHYLKCEGIAVESESLTLQQLAEERLMMGLRTKWGVSVQALSGKYDYDFNSRQKEYLRKCLNENLADMNDHIRLTDKGIAIADAIILDLVSLY